MLIFHPSLSTLKAERLVAAYLAIVISEFLSHTSQKKKNVILISSMHNCGEIDQQSGSKQKPDVITYYNKTKCGVACVDQMRAPYTVARCSCRPLTVFFALMDIAAINSQIVYRSNHNITVERREFLKILSKSLTRPWLEKRLKIRNLSFEIINIIQKKSLYHWRRKNHLNIAQGSLRLLPTKQKSKNDHNMCNLF